MALTKLGLSFHFGARVLSVAASLLAVGLNLAVGFDFWQLGFGSCAQIEIWRSGQLLAVGFCHWRPGPNFIIIWRSGFGCPVGFWQSGRVYRFGSRLLVVVNFGFTVLAIRSGFGSWV